MAIFARPLGNVSAARLPWGIHYSWVIVGVLAVIQIFGSSIFMIGGIMVPPLSGPVAEGGFGWSIGVIGGAIAVYYLFGAIFAPISGYLGDRFGTRRMALSGILLYGVGMCLLGFTTQVWHFFLFYSLIMSLAASITMVPLMAAVSGWFRRRMGWAIGVMWAVGGVGTAALAPVIAYMLDALGWRDTFLAVGIGGAAVMLLLFPLMRNKPADVGIEPYGTRKTDPPPMTTDSAIAKVRLKVFNQHIRRTRAFWNLPVIHGLGCAGHGIVLVYVVPLAVEQGISLTTAAVTITIIMLVSIISRLGSPVLAEMYGPRKMMTASLIIQGLTVLMLFWAQDVWVFYLFGAAFGFGFGGEWTSYMEINRRYFGAGPLGTCYGWQMTGAMLGHAITTALAGLVIIATGSLYPVFALSVAFSLAGVIVIATLDSTSKVLIPHWEDDLPAEAQAARPRTAPAAGDG